MPLPESVECDALVVGSGASGMACAISAARAYIADEADAGFNPARVDAFLAHAAEAAEFFTARSALEFDMPVAFPDCHAEAPGGSLQDH